MKKLLLSALAISAMFVSCGDKDKGEMPAPPKKVDTSAKGAFVEIYDIQENMYKKSTDELIQDFNKIKGKLAVDGFSQMAGAQTIVQAQFDGWIQGVKPDGEAKNGQAGKLGKRYLDERGIENGQLIKKGMIGAYQFSNVVKVGYQALIDKNRTAEKDKKYLEEIAVALIGSYDYIDNQKVDLESHGKKFKGYPVMDGNEFGKYLNVVSNSEVADFKTMSDDFYGALKKAKKAVGTEDFVPTVMKAIGIAQKVVAIRCVHYFQKVKGDNYKKGKLDDGVAHGISEGLGFYYSLQFTYNDGTHKPYVSHNEASDLVETINLWDTKATTTKLNVISAKLSELFGFSIEDAEK